MRISTHPLPAQRQRGRGSPQIRCASLEGPRARSGARAGGRGTRVLELTTVKAIAHFAVRICAARAEGECWLKTKRELNFSPPQHVCGGALSEGEYIFEAPGGGLDPTRRRRGGVGTLPGADLFETRLPAGQAGAPPAAPKDHSPGRRECESVVCKGSEFSFVVFPEKGCF